MTDCAPAVFLSYASQEAAAAQRSAKHRARPVWQFGLTTALRGDPRYEALPGKIKLPE